MSAKIYDSQKADSIVHEAAEQRRRRTTHTTSHSSPPPPPPAPSAESDAVPPLEPPARASARIAPQRIRRQWILARWHEMPGWATSLVAHLTIVIVMASLFVPPGFKRQMHLLTFAFSTDTNDETVTEVVIPEEVVEPISGPSADVIVEAGTGDEEVEEPSQPPPPETESTSDLIDEEQLASVADASPSGESLDLVEGVGDVQFVGNVQPNEGETVASSFKTQVLAATTPLPPELDRANAHDKVVDRFILYDIGKLTGVEGNLAHRDFVNLHGDSIPALVRGLNKSAEINASCPVCVISRKLQQAVAESDDPQLVRYALDNVGKDVNPEAPHAKMVAEVRRRMLQNLETEETVRIALEERGLPTDAKLVNNVRNIRRLRPEQIHQSAESSDNDGLLTIAIACQLDPAPNFTREQSVDLGARMAEVMTQSTPEERDVYHETLTSFVDAYPPLPDPRIDLAANASVSAPSSSLAARQWSIFWQQQIAAVADQKTQKQLKNARWQVERGRLRTAADIYRNIVENHPNTRSALDAAAELQELDMSKYANSKLKLATTLERRGRKSAAVRYYEAVVKDYPKSDAAEEARRAIKRLSGS